jgi:DNA-binding response OmpR family regulator
MRTILLIESNSTQRAQLASTLQRAGYVVLVSASAAEARSTVTRTSVDLTIVSNSLSDWVDVELVQWLRGQPAAKTLPILAISTDPSVHARLSALAAGANDHVAWPFSTEHVVDRIQNLLNRRDHLPSVAPQGFARRVLVVDDSPTYGNALMDELQKDGHDVVLAETGTDAMRFLERHRADLVVLDVFLPDISGVEVCRRIKSTTRTSGIPVLMLTGRERSAIRADAAAAHADELAVKSRDFEAIRGKVRLMLVKSPVRTISSCQLEAVFLEPGTSSRTSGVGYRNAPPMAESSPPPRSAGSVNRTSAATLDATTSRIIGAAQRTSVSQVARGGAGSANRLGAALAMDPTPSSAASSSTRLLAAAPMAELSQDKSSNGMLAATPYQAGGLRGEELFASIVRGTGLSELLARSTVESICRRLEIVPSELSPQDVIRVIEGLDRTLRLFLPPGEAKKRLMALSRLGQ